MLVAYLNVARLGLPGARNNCRLQIRAYSLFHARAVFSLIYSLSENFVLLPLHKSIAPLLLEQFDAANPSRLFYARKANQ